MRISFTGAVVILAAISITVRVAEAARLLAADEIDGRDGASLQACCAQTSTEMDIGGAVMGALFGDKSCKCGYPAPAFYDARVHTIKA